MRVKLWVCTDECGNYFGSKSQERLDLREEQVYARPEDRTEIKTEERDGVLHVVAGGERIVKGVRSRCPDCGADRAPVWVEVSRSSGLSHVTAVG
jgi:hypothetical protein